MREFLVALRDANRALYLGPLSMHVSTADRWAAFDRNKQIELWFFKEKGSAYAANFEWRWPSPAGYW